MFERLWNELRATICFFSNPEKIIRQKVKKSGKIEQEQKTLISSSAYVLMTNTEF